jgi:hypothetical protein
MTVIVTVSRVMQENFPTARTWMPVNFGLTAFPENLSGLLQQLQPIVSARIIATAHTPAPRICPEAFPSLCASLENG